MLTTLYSFKNKFYSKFLVWSLVLSLLPTSYLSALEIQEIKNEPQLKVWLVEDHSVPVVSVNIAIRGGSRLDPEDKSGLAELTIALMQNGTTDLSEQAFKDKLNIMSTTLSMDCDDDWFYINLYSLSDNIVPSFALVHDALTKPSFSQETFEKYKKRFLLLTQHQEKEKEFLAARSMAKILYPDHPYSRYAHASSVSSLTQQDVVQFFNNSISKTDVRIAISGDIKADQAQTLIASLLDDIKTHDPSTFSESSQKNETLKNALLNDQKISEEMKGQIVQVPFDIPMTYYLIAQKAVKIEDPSWHTQQVLVNIYGGNASFKSRLNKTLRVKNGLTYGFSVSPMLQNDLTLLSTEGETKNETASKTLDLIVKEMSSLTDNSITQEEVDMAKENMKGAFWTKLTSNRAMTSLMSTYLMYDLPISRFYEYNQNIDRVTLQQVKDFAHAYFNPENMLVIAVGQPMNLASNIREYLPNIAQKEQQSQTAVESPKPNSVPANSEHIKSENDEQPASQSQEPVPHIESNSAQ